ncbi:two-partner secretion domain-containing protein [Allocoleopsis franciscana]|uniref:Filamentous hemagglutinin family N-terminal domain protein n=1 Tax=Allocoleopsis franciscana PCC 7113 TaxID=1173027 RepID=K9WQ68_9CYAN|nr:filamentous hemagglutinin N-terminal domain-containing protein [Allocoleopsis franciscana]AFZ21687.1 filamentous hemagglutinin family N-terminal domain protein [Allocoleopsis franciscana PCC 7113]
MKQDIRLLGLSSSICFYCLTATAPTQAQSNQPVQLDGSTSTSSIRGDCSISCTITGQHIGGNNLFHSFKEFNIDPGATVIFDTPAGVTRILSRVTGNDYSHIQGTLQVLGSADLFLLNPHGIIFGSNAQLNINGSFVASTASSLIFNDGSLFSATDTTPPLLTVSVPVGLQFGATPGSITHQSGDLQVKTGQTLALVGGDVNLLGGNLRAPGGRIELGSVAANSLVSLTPNPSTRGWVLGYESVQKFKNIQLSQGAVVSTTNIVSGDIQLYGRQITIADGSQVGGFTIQGTSATKGGTLVIHADDSLEVKGTALNDPTKASALFTGTFGAGQAGDISIKAKQLFVDSGGTVIASTFKNGQGGNITLDIEQSVNVIGSDSKIITQAEPGSTGGAGGQLQITTEKLMIRDGGQIATSTFGSGNGGTLLVDASEVEVSGRSQDGHLPSGLFAQSLNDQTRGNGGNLIINTNRLVVEGGANISVASRRGSQGNAGRLEVNASKVEVIGTGLDQDGNIVPSSLLASTASGQGGNITINLSNYLLLSNGSQISTSAEREGNGGQIRINQGFVVAAPTNSNSDIIANAINGRAGGIIINSESVLGLIVWTPEKIAKEFATDSNQFQPRNQPSNDITAFSQNPALSGTITITTPKVDPSQGLTQLPEEPVDATQQISQACSGDQKDVVGENKFVITGRGGLPSSPADLFSTDQVLTDLGTPVAPTAIRTRGRTITPPAPSPALLVEAQGWFIDGNGVVHLVAQGSNATPQSHWQPPVQCPSS